MCCFLASARTCCRRQLLQFSNVRPHQQPCVRHEAKRRRRSSNIEVPLGGAGSTKTQRGRGCRVRSAVGESCKACGGGHGECDDWCDTLIKENFPLLGKSRGWRVKECGERNDGRA